nr:isoform 4 of atp-dependent dna helicase pif1 [Quercus suber]
MAGTAVKEELSGGQKRKNTRPQSAADAKRARRNHLAFEALGAFKTQGVRHGTDAGYTNSTIKGQPTYDHVLYAPRQPLGDVQPYASSYNPAPPRYSDPEVIDLTVEDDIPKPLPQPTLQPWSAFSRGDPYDYSEAVQNLPANLFPMPWSRPNHHDPHAYVAQVEPPPELPWHSLRPDIMGTYANQYLGGQYHDIHRPFPHNQYPDPYPRGSVVSRNDDWPPGAPVRSSESKIDIVDLDPVTAPQRIPTYADLSGSSELLRNAQITKTCSCGEHAAIGDNTVFCAADGCEHECFHKACVGLTRRKDTSGWRCYKCRPKTVPQSSVTKVPGHLSAEFPPTMVCPVATAPNQIPKYTPISGEPEPRLHEEQEKVVRAITIGYNVFYTGSAGVGKSTVLKAFVQTLKQNGKHVDIIAPSGIAALNVGGMTIHAYAGWHVDAFKEGLGSLVSKSHGKNVRKRLCQTDVLVIDEISMVERDVLVRLDVIMREIRQTWQRENPTTKKKSPHTAHEPFGGVQVVVTGDFCQLPPVKPFRFCLHCGGDELPGYENKDGRTLKCDRCGRMYEDKQKWAFQSETWAACRFQYFELRHIHRQSDKTFIDILQKCRFGYPLSPTDQQLLLTPKPDPEGAVKLLPRRAEVDTENLKNYRGLQSIERKFECVDYFSWRNKQEPSINQKYSPLKYPHRPDGPLMALKDHRLEEQILLKEGMLVILITNLDFESGLVNGSQGKIIGFEKHDDKNVFEPQAQAPPPPPGSKRRAIDAGRPAAYDTEYGAIKESQVREFIARTAVLQWPIVEFHNGVIRPIYAECQLGELGSEKPYSLLGRTQIPLLAAWAITVHKSQGMTLNRVIVDLYSSFEKEMVYVALSRARNLEGLKVLRLARQMDSGVNEEVQGFLAEHGMLS